MDFRLKSLTDSFNYAITGLVHAVRTQRNMRIHVITAIVVMTACLILGVTKAEFIMTAISVTLVISAELFNTAIESAVDATTNHYHPLVKIAKNTAAAAVLVTALNAVVVGYLVFWNRITVLTYRGITFIHRTSPYITAVVLGVVCLTVIFLKATVGEGTPLRGGMPSGHSAVAFAMATMMSYISKNHVIITLAFMLALIVAQSRVESRIHTFAEVAAGAAIGILITVLLFSVMGYVS